MAFELEIRKLSPKRFKATTKILLKETSYGQRMLELETFNRGSEIITTARAYLQAHIGFQVSSVPKAELMITRHQNPIEGDVILAHNTFLKRAEDFIERLRAIYTEEV